VGTPSHRTTSRTGLPCRRLPPRDRADRRGRGALLEERDRIARDLHDLAIERLFATGMTLQSAVRFVDHPQAGERLRWQVPLVPDGA
jgi:signal transduction histidine kinase